MITHNPGMRPIIVALTFLLASCGVSREEPSAMADIRAVMMHDWNKPEAPLSVDPIVVVGNFAVADWTQPALGGRALLVRSGDHWSVALCAGDSLKDPTMLAHAGMSATDAEALLRALSIAEETVPAERLARIAAFKGVVRMGGGHPESAR
jgi:hypothetical protein